MANDFLPFAWDPGANVISQGAWAGLSARTNGWVAGVAQSSQVNKAVRQATLFAAALGQFIDDYSTLDATDDGNVANLSLKFAQTILGAPWARVLATGTANAWVVTTTPVLAAYANGRPLYITAPATNTSTTVNANISGLGNRRIKKADGTDPAVGDLVSGRTYPTVDDGTNILVLAFLPSDLGAQKSAFNVTRTVYTARVSLSGTGMVSYQTGSYTKKSATSQLVVDTYTNAFSTAGAGLAFGRVTGLPSNLEWIVRNGDNSTSSPGSIGSRIYTGVAAGAISWSWLFGRNDATAWQSIINPRSPTDASFLPAETTSYIQFSELEP